MGARASALRVVVEAGAKRTFASAVDFPGWSRAGTTEDTAVASLLEYADRYARVADRAGIALPSGAGVEVIERLSGDATTDFGAPNKPATCERAAGNQAERERRVALLRAAWAEFDDVAVAAPATLRKGPRGGGRDTAGVMAHVTEAERAYKGKLGIRGITEPLAVREAIVQAILDDAAVTSSGRSAPWPTPYAARRIAWHVLDHAWEIEDKSH